ncbi:mannitol 2-dehydrogenase [Roseibium hamelinense]|uniref:Mannitol 2-dehydrogenase n=1 Tax=Roseibium hamelinense TaxID=150831 RepID=A0A562T2Y8_9HYPH|nr:mannitol dehydrogenase family protein [Roseibium hamelinense]MTI43809.1 mannitol dehydrogenase family protein [Roseibium hamelinense]TWI87110.1 mannitol 2-dehydrogenase [Roseibium hamelinense]
MDELIRLSNATLGSVPEQVARPRYDRSALTPGIVHIGVGNFHRAHQAWYLHRLMQEGKALDWAIIGAGVRPYDADMRDKLLSQDCLTALIELNPSATSAEIVGSMTGYLPIEPDNAPLIAKMADPAIRIVALTVTEGGYYIDPVSNAFDARHLDIVHDAARPDTPRTAFGAIAAALRHRRDNDAGPLTLLSCDNLLGNGRILRQTVVGLARLSDPALADWIETRCSFPNSMVDCIVPATGPREIALAREFGIEDRAPVSHEAFRQWVLEDDFCAGRPDWEQAGATFTNDVHAYEMMKLRMLNAGHQVIANAGEILSLGTIADCMAHPLVSGLFFKVLNAEIVPHVAPVPGMTPAAYADLIHGRFANPAILDTTRRVAFDGSSRHTGFVLPVIRDALAAGTPVEGLALVEALWARMCAGTREDGTEIEPNDPNWDQLNRAAWDARVRPHAWLEQHQVYGDLADNRVLAGAFDRWLKRIWSSGCEPALRDYLNPPQSAVQSLG